MKKFLGKVSILLLLFTLCVSCSKSDGSSFDDEDNPSSISSTSSYSSLLKLYNTEEKYLINDIKSYNRTTNIALRASLLRGIRSTQKLMRTIRAKAAKEGYTIPKSTYEDW